jgi:methenyltetrahydrofolate cyclohydrolase
MPYASQSMEDFLEQLGGATPSPASGTAAAFAAAMAAALVELAAGVSADAEAVSHARVLRFELVRLAEDDAAAYTAFMRTRSDADRVRTIEVPSAMSRLADEVAKLADDLSERCKPSVAGDAFAGAELARAAARTAERLAEINLRG